VARPLERAAGGPQPAAHRWACLPSPGWQSPPDGDGDHLESLVDGAVNDLCAAPDGKRATVSTTHNASKGGQPAQSGGRPFKQVGQGRNQRRKSIMIPLFLCPSAWLPGRRNRTV